MIEEALLTRAHGLDRDALVRTRGRQVFVTTPFDVLACRTSPVDIPEVVAKVSLLLDTKRNSVSKDNELRQGSDAQSRDNDSQQPFYEGRGCGPVRFALKPD